MDSISCKESEMLSSSGSSRPLNELSHEETKQLLLGLGCDAFNDECDFIQSKMTGSDLAEVESSDDLLECGVIAKKLRIKSIFTKLMTYKESGVPESSLSSQLLPTNIVQNVANLTVSSDSTAAVTAPAPPAAPAPIAPVVSSNEEGPVFPPMRNREQTESLISKFVKEYSTSITNQVLECAYTAYFHPRPNDAALEWWTKAYLEREKVIDTLDKSTQNKHHKEANRCIEEALKADFWLPFRHACLWNYQGNTPSVIFRIEYDALRDSFQSMEREGHKLSDNQMEIKRKIDNIFNELSWSDGDGFRLSICRSGAHAKEGAGCIAGCLKLADSTSYYCCANHFQIPTNFTRGQSTTWGERRDIYQLCSLPLQEWDPCVSFYSVVNWPAPDNIRTTNYDLRTIWRGGKGEKKKYFLQHSSICSKFALFPQVFLNSNSTLFGSVTQNMNTIDKLDLGNVFKELIQVRNRFVGHGTVTFNAEDLWWTFTMVLIAAHIGNQQATFWTNTYEGMKNPVAQLPYYPTFDACKKLRDGTQLICSKLLQDDEVIKSNINLQLETDTYQEFVDSVNKFRQRESFQILLIPPLPCEFIPSSLAAVPWDLVVDFADIGSATLPTESTAWKLMKEASSQNGAIKPTHKVSYNPSHIFRKQTDLLCSYLEEINPVHIPWWQITAATDSGLLSPLFDADGLKRDAQTVDDVMDSINSVVQHIFQTRVLRNRSVQIVLPMYGVCEIPCQNATSKRWFFRNTYSSFPSSVDRNYATPYFLRQILRSLTIDPKVVVKCTVLFQLDNSLASIGKSCQHIYIC